jgi:hypothetical protein
MDQGDPSPMRLTGYPQDRLGTGRARACRTGTTIASPMTSNGEPPPERRRPGNGLMIGGGIVAIFAVGIYFSGMPYIQSGECIESCVTTQYVVPIVLIAVAVTLFVIGWRRMRP